MHTCILFWLDTAYANERVVDRNQATFVRSENMRKCYSDEGTGDGSNSKRHDSNTHESIGLRMIGAHIVGPLEIFSRCSFYFC